MAGEPQRDRVGMAANDCSLALVQSPRRLRQTRLAADKPRPFRGKVDFEIALAGNRFEANSDGALKGLGRSFLRCAFRFDVGAHLSIVIPGRREMASPESILTVVAVWFHDRDYGSPLSAFALCAPAFAKPPFVELIGFA
jgi:hypothetical protein